MTADVVVPEGCEAVVHLPGCAPVTVGAGRHRLASGDGRAAA
jgi:alpha-L-rhamnosidase